MRQILRFLENMLPYMLADIPALLLFRFLRVKQLQRRGNPSGLLREAALLFFLLFLVGLASQTVIPKIDLLPGGSLALSQTAGGGVNLVPFAIVSDCAEAFRIGDSSYFLINVVGNIVMFLPIGLFLPLLWRVSAPRAVLGGFCASLFVELCQLPQPRGTDIDDLWLNTLGAALGALLFLLLQKAAPAFCARFRICPMQKKGCAE